MKRNFIVAIFAVLLCSLGALPASAQTVSAQVEGTVTDAGKPIAKATVTLTNKGTGRVFKVKTDKNGKFLMVGVPYGDYEVEVTSESGEKLYHQKENQVAPGESSAAVAMKIDISETTSSTSGSSQTGQGGQPPSGAAGQQQQPQQPQPKYTKEQIEAIKKSNEKIMAQQPLIQQAQTALSAKNWEAAIPPLQQLITVDPGNWQYYSFLGNSQLQLGKYDEAVDSYQKGIEAAEAMTTVDPKNPITDPAKKKAGEAQMLTNQGNAYLKLHKNAEATADFTKAASMDPNPGVAYWNLCATQYNTGNVEGALDACDKAIAADPNRADAYFIKGSLLIAGSKTDANGKVTAPPGTAEALNKYLELQPDGPHANDVKQMLAYIGSKVETTYKKKGK